MTDELKPCPFCGGNAKILRKVNGKPTGIVCQECLLIMEPADVHPKRHTLDELIARWNARAERTCRLLSLTKNSAGLTYAVTTRVSNGVYIEDLPFRCCSECGAKVLDGSRYCQMCGAKVVE